MSQAAWTLAATCAVTIRLGYISLFVPPLPDSTSLLTGPSVPVQYVPALPLGAFDRSPAGGGFSLFHHSPVAKHAAAAAAAAAAGLSPHNHPPVYQLFGPVSGKPGADVQAFHAPPLLPVVR